MISFLSGVPETWWRLGDESARNPTSASPERRTPVVANASSAQAGKWRFGCSCLGGRHADTCISLPVRNSLNYECRFLSSCLPSSSSSSSSPIELRVLVRTQIDRVAMPDSMSSRRGFARARARARPREREWQCISSANVLISAIRGRRKEALCN